MTPSVERPASARPVVPVVAVTRAKPSTEAAPQPRRSPRGAPRAVAIAALAVFAGLAPRPVEGDEGVPVSIENQSQYELFELRIHATPSYLDAPNVLATPLAIGAATELACAGPFHVTFIRERYAGGPAIAFTTARPIDPAGTRTLRVVVFDESFRVHAEPTTAPADAGCGCTSVPRRRPGGPR